MIHAIAHESIFFIARTGIKFHKAIKTCFVEKYSFQSSDKSFIYDFTLCSYQDNSSFDVSLTSDIFSIYLSTRLSSISVNLHKTNK